MQLTKFDRWLKEKFIYETHIFTLRLPDDPFPKGVKIRGLDEDKGGDYRHRLVIKDNQVAERVMDQLRANHIMHATHVMEAKNWYNSHISPKGGGSFTYRWILRLLSLIMIASVVWGVLRATESGELSKAIKSSLEELKGGL